MPFDGPGIIEALSSSFAKGGKSDFLRFVDGNISAHDWVIASDFNIGAPGAPHDVFAFALFPAKEGVVPLRNALAAALPHDFKRTRSISSAQKKFLSDGQCFCCVFMVPTQRTLLRCGARDEQRENLRTLLLGAREVIEARRQPRELAHIDRMLAEADRSSVNVRLMENLLLFATLQVFVAMLAGIYAAPAALHWYPDRDDMTTYCNGAWSTLAAAGFSGHVASVARHYPVPQVLFLDHTKSLPAQIFDPFVRVADYLAATLSRWDLERRVIVPPLGAKKKSAKRYTQIFRAWVPENGNLWVSRLRLDESGPRATRIVSFRRPRRLRRELARIEASST